VAAVGVAVAALVLLTSEADPMQLVPSLQPLAWPDLPILPALAIALGVVPAWLAPPVDRPQPNPRRRDDSAVASASRPPIGIGSVER
jgi:energy-coupling factor transport system permease protein